MTIWVTVLLACTLAYLLKLGGFLVPRGLLEGPAVRRISAALPIALLSALVATQAFTGPGGDVVLDARAAAVGVALVALALRAPFLLVVALGALTAALLRLAGWS